MSAGATAGGSSGSADMVESSRMIQIGRGQSALDAPMKVAKASLLLADSMRGLDPRLHAHHDGSWVLAVVGWACGGKM